MIDRDELIEKLRALWKDCPNYTLGQILDSVLVLCSDPENPVALENLSDELLERGIGNFHMHVRRGQPIPPADKKRKKKKEP